MSARFYIYRNLHQGGAFSVKLRGRVIDRSTDFIAQDVLFKVSEPGRQRVLSEQRKNVHAYAAARTYAPVYRMDTIGLMQVCYNPFTAPTFMVGSIPIYEAASLLFTGGKCYLLEK